MAFQLPPLPNFNVQIPDLQQKALEGAQLRNMLSEQALRQQLAPLQVQQAQAQTQQAQQQAELGRIQLQDSQAFSNYIKNGTGTDEAPSDFTGRDRIATLTGMAKDDPYMGVLSGLSKAGMSGLGLMAQAQTAIQRRTEYNKGTVEQQNIIKGNYDVFKDAMARIFNADPKEWGPLVADALPRLAQATHLSPELDTLVKLLQQDPQVGVPIAYNAVAAQEKQLGLRKAGAEAQKAELGVQPPSASQLSTFTSKTIPSFSALRPEQKNAFIAEAQGARTVDELDKVKERADATDKAEQMHKDSLAQTVALKGLAFSEEGLKDNDKTWTDPQHGFLQTLTQANLGKKAIAAGADGNGLLTSLEPTMVVLGMNSFAGTHRISPAEASAAGAPGGWAERLNAWAAKAATGKLSEQVAKEGRELFDDMIDAKHQSSVQASAFHALGHNIPPKNMPAMDKEGNLTTLDKVAGGKGQPKAGGGIPQPPGATMRVPGSDGHMYWSDGKANLGRAD